MFTARLRGVAAAGVLAGLAIAPLSAGAAPPIPVTACETITAAGAYQLQNDLVATPSSDCIDIFGSGVTLDLNGKSISTPTAGKGFGVFLTGQNDAVQNGTVAGFGVGVGASTATGTVFQGLTVTGSTSVGILDQFGSGGAIQGNTVTGGGIGILLNGWTGAAVQGNTVRSSGAAPLTGVGIQLSGGAAGNVVQGNTVSGAPQVDILVGGVAPTADVGCSGRSPVDSGNTVSGNTVRQSPFGIVISCGLATHTTLLGNSAPGFAARLGLVDGNPTCDADQWLGNAGTRNQGCIH